MTIKTIHSKKGIEIIKLLSESGKRIFTLKDANVINKSTSIRSILHFLTKEGWIVRLKPGVYGIQMPGAQPLHEFEIAMALVKPAAISHWSAMSYHGFTDQAPRKIFVTTISNPPKYQANKKMDKNSVESGYPVMGIFYQFIKTQPERFFGHTKIWIGDSQITITDKERTLIDGLLSPEYCGGFHEVLSCFERARSSIDVQKLIDYSLKLDLVVPKRLGWILENLKICKNNELKKLESHPMPSIGLLNPSESRKGSINKRWNLIENIHGKITK